MNIEVLLFGNRRELATRQQVVSLVAGARLIDLIEWLVKENGVDFGKEVNHIEGLHILINGQYYDLLGGMETPLEEGDVVAMLPLLAGG